MQNRETTVIEATARGIPIVGTLHDAIFIEVPLEGLDEYVRTTIEVMQQASETLLVCPTLHEHYRLRVDANVVKYPSAYVEKGAQGQWDSIKKMLRQFAGRDLDDAHACV